jgi:hypothetical protein
MPPAAPVISTLRPSSRKGKNASPAAAIRKLHPPPAQGLQAEQNPFHQGRQHLVEKMGSQFSLAGRWVSFHHRSVAPDDPPGAACCAALHQARQFYAPPLPQPMIGHAHLHGFPRH